jgi:hypothetical protein
MWLLASPTRGCSPPSVDSGNSLTNIMIVGKNFVEPEGAAVRP